MAELVRTEGIVLKRRDFTESSRIAVIYTQSQGKVHLLAKGARRPRNRFGAALEPLARAEFVFYWHPHKDLFLLKEAAVVPPASRAAEDAAVLPFALAAAEATDKLTGEEDADPTLYATLAETLEALYAGFAGPRVLIRFLFLLCRRAGLTLDLSTCGGCGRDVAREGVYFLPAEGRCLCPGCWPGGSEGMKISSAGCGYARALQSLAVNRLGRLRFPPGLESEILNVLRCHIEYRTGVTLASLALL